MRSLRPDLAQATANPLHALGAARPGTRTNGVRAQRQRVLDRLHFGPATRGELARDCYCPSPTKRVSELRRSGWDIRSQWVEERAPDGTVSPTVRYSLHTDPDAAQLPLPLDE